MDASGQNYKDIFRYTDVEYTPEGHTDVYRWDDFLGIAGGHVLSAKCIVDSVSPGGEFEGDEPEYAYACEIVGCCGLSDGVALLRPVSHGGNDLIQIAFLRNDTDDATGAYTERFEAGSFDIPSTDLPCSEFGVDLLEYFSGRSFEGVPGVSRGLDPHEAVDSIEDAIGCDLGLFDSFWLGVPGEADMRVGPYSKKSLFDFSYYAKELSCRYGFADSDILEIARRLPEECPNRFAAVKAYLDCEYVPDGDAPDEKTYRWGDFFEIAGGDARYAAMLVDRTAAGEPEEGLHPETLVDQDIRDGEAFMLAGRPIAPEDAYDLPGTVHGLYKELADNVDRSGMLFRDWRGFAAGTDADAARHLHPGAAFLLRRCAEAGAGVLPASQQATASGGMPRHRRDVRVGIPGGPRVRHCRRGRARIGQHGRRTQRAPLLLRRRTEAGLGVLQGTTFEDQAHRLPGNRRDLRRQPGRRPSPARIAGRHQPGRPRWIACRRAPFLPWRRTEAGTGVLQAGQARTRQEPFTDGGRGEGRRGEPGSPGRWPAAPTRGIIDAVGKAPSVSEGAFLHL